MVDWRLADAKNKFSELVTRALSEGPQRVFRRNDAVVVIAEDEYERLTGEQMSFKTFLTTGPDFDDLDLTRDRSAMRDIEL